jgi:L-amino acid N-acyltransferase YncA
MFVIRPATHKDLPQVRAINIHYVHNTSLTFLQNPISQTQLIAKFEDITASRGLPYLVAIETHVGETEETVVGYTYLSPFRGHMLSYGPTVELTLFVHPEYQNRAVGSQLLSAVLESARAPGVQHRSREMVVGDDGRERVIYGGDGQGVPIRNVLAVMSVDPEGKDGGEALKRWYIKRGFAERGRMEKVGFKKGRW